MGRKALTLGAALIGVYLAVRYFQGFSKDEGAAATGGVGLIKAFQGR